MNKTIFSFGIAIGIIVGGSLSYLLLNKKSLATIPKKCNEGDADENNFVPLEDSSGTIEIDIPPALHSNEQIPQSASAPAKKDPYLDSESEEVSKTSPTDKLKWTLENAKDMLDQKTTKWAEKLPKPKNVQEEFFHLYLQIAYEKSFVDVVELAALNVGHFSDMPDLDQFDVYIAESLKKLEIGKEQRIRNFLYRYVRLLRPYNAYPIEDDIKAYIKNPKSFIKNDIDNLKNIFMAVRYIKDQDKKKLLTEAELLSE